MYTNTNAQPCPNAECHRHGHTDPDCDPCSLPAAPAAKYEYAVMEESVWAKRLGIAVMAGFILYTVLFVGFSDWTQFGGY